MKASRTIIKGLMPICFLFAINNTYANNLTVAAGQEASLPAGKHRIQYSRLILKSGASLVIPESYSGKRLILRADHFEAEKGAKIHQYFSKRAAQGRHGSQGRQPDYGETGGPGGNGGVGVTGKPTVDLRLELGIARLEAATILLRSQAGGHGGNGGKGGIGGGASCNQGEDGGNGGRGGRGGAGGPPGPAGPLAVVWWPVGADVPSFRSDQPVGLTVVLQTGQGGWGGPAGQGGDGHGGRSCGWPVSDRTAGSPGPHGQPGQAWSGMGQYHSITFQRREMAP